MSLHVGGARPQSGRPQSRINPITGEEMPYSARAMTARGEDFSVKAVSKHPPPQDRGDTRQKTSNSSPPYGQQSQAQHQHENQATKSHFKSQKSDARPKHRPDGVPKLSLGKLGDTNDDPDLTLHMDPYEYKLSSPGASSRMSWGARSIGLPQEIIEAQTKPKQSRDIAKKDRHSARQKTEREQFVPENLPAPSQRYKDQYAKLERDIKESYRQHSTRSITESEVADKIAELRLEIPAYVTPEEDDDRDQLQKAWTEQPYSKAAQLRRQDKESLEELNRKKKLLETVLIDQLSRPVISYPEQRPPSSNRNQSYRPRTKGTVRTMHDSSRISTSTTPTENLLSRRLQFGARVLTRCGRDAIRELTGFYFAVDNSITVYEFKQFGKSAKALPFVKRGVYSHLTGSRRQQPYELSDIKQGESLALETRDQPFPDSMKAQDVAEIRITYVDDEAKATILFEDVPVHEQDDVWKRAHIPQTKDEINAKLLQIRVRECVRSQICKRGLKVYTGLYKRFDKLDESDNGQLNKVELEKGLIDFHIDIPQEDYDDYWELLDIFSTSFLEYDKFIRGYLGEMSETRKSLVRKAFCKIDPNKKGAVTFADIRKFYNAYKHPKVKSGECSEQEVLENFLSHFHGGSDRNSISYYEFEIYYEGLSVCVVSEEDFAKILQNAWGI